MTDACPDDIWVNKIDNAVPHLPVRFSFPLNPIISTLNPNLDSLNIILCSFLTNGLSIACMMVTIAGKPLELCPSGPWRMKNF